MFALLAMLACSTCPKKQVAEPHTEVLCPDLYDDDKVVDIKVEIAPEEWEALVEDYETWEMRLRNRLDPKPYHPLERFEAAGEVIEDAQIRLKGNPCCSWDGDKMQFVIAFNKEDPNGRFQGLRKIALDAPPYDPSLLRERVALSYFRDAGIASSCANHATLEFNGEPYGVYTNIEFVDREFLERQFPDQDDFGNLYKWGYNDRRFQQENNSGEPGDIEPYREIATLEEMSLALDVEQSLHYWAAEAMINQSDGYWAGSINFYLYHHPTQGWQYFPWDLDNAVTFWRAKRDPFTRTDFHRIAPFMDWVLEDEGWTERYRQALAVAHSQHDVDLLVDRIDTWSAQIRPYVEADAHREYSMEEHDEAVADIRRRLKIRDDYVCGLVH